MANKHEVRLRARPAAPLFLAAGLVLGAVLGWYVRDFTATRDMVAEAKVRLAYCVQSAMGNSRADWIAEDRCDEEFQVAIEKFFNRAGAMEQGLRERWTDLRCMIYAHTRTEGETTDGECAEISAATVQQLSDGLRELIDRMDEAAAGFWP